MNPPRRSAGDVVVKVAIPLAVKGLFDYYATGDILPGCRVLVPFRQREVIGVVMVVERQTSQKKSFQIYAILDREEKPFYTQYSLILAKWLASYYHTPIGEVLKLMAPAAFTYCKQNLYRKNPLFKEMSTTEEQGWIDKIFVENRIISRPDFQNFAKNLVKISTFHKALKAGWIEHAGCQKKKRLRSWLLEKPEIDLETCFHPPAYNLSREQEEALLAIYPQLTTPSSKPVLLHGVTGSGKTEIFFHLVDRIMKGDLKSQCLLMVPEIALTPQLVSQVKERFIAEIVVVHSGLSNTKRWQAIQNIRSGKAQIIVGPRSCILLPFFRLKLIIVDEEHDGSYKSCTSFSYHARDVAVMRAKYENIPVILASATPSLESFYNAQQGRYSLVVLKNRIGALPLPHVYPVLQPPQNFQREVIHEKAKFIEGNHSLLIHPKIVQKLHENFNSGKQAIVILNRRGYAQYLYTPKEGKVLQCRSCHISMTYHRQKKQAVCHYCGHVENICLSKGEQYMAVGFGCEKVDRYLKACLPTLRITRFDSELSAQPSRLQSVLDSFRRGDIDLLVGTQMLAKGHDFPNVQVMVLLDVDQMLCFPDFRAGERTFQLIVQASGRAGRFSEQGEVYIQSHDFRHEVIQASLAQDFEQFFLNESYFRQTFRYPPYSRAILLELTSKEEEKLEVSSRELSRWMIRVFPPVKNMNILGPTTPSVDKIRCYYRKHILLMSTDLFKLHQITDLILKKMNKHRMIRIRVDVDPQSIL